MISAIFFKKPPALLTGGPQSDMQNLKALCLLVVSDPQKTTVFFRKLAIGGDMKKIITTVNIDIKVLRRLKILQDRFRVSRSYLVRMLLSKILQDKTDTELIDWLKK